MDNLKDIEFTGIALTKNPLNPNAIIQKIITDNAAEILARKGEKINRLIVESLKELGIEIWIEHEINDNSEWLCTKKGTEVIRKRIEDK